MIRLALLPEAAFGLAAVMTYLIHSTLWFAGAWAAARPRLGQNASARSLLWRAALIGPVLSTALALGLSDGWRVAALELALTSPTEMDAPRAAAASRAGEGGAALAGGVAGVESAMGAGEAETPPGAPAPFVRASSRIASPSPGALGAANEPRVSGRAGAGWPPGQGWAWWRRGWPDVLVLLLVVVGGGRLVVMAVRQRRFWRRLRGRQALLAGPACDHLRMLAVRARLPFSVRLSQSPCARSPMALGRREICLPPRALEELAVPALSAVLAHELAHLERDDNRWLTLGAVIEATLFFQPLTRRIRRELEAAAELACDERAVVLTDNAVDLARSIAIVAGWHVGVEDLVPVAPMARSRNDGGDVVGRVKALLECSRCPSPIAGTRRPRLAIAGLVACGLMAPAIAGPGARAANAPGTGGEESPPAAPGTSAVPAAKPAQATTGSPAATVAPAGQTPPAAPASRAARVARDANRAQRAARPAPAPAPAWPAGTSFPPLPPIPPLPANPPLPTFPPTGKNLPATPPIPSLPSAHDIRLDEELARLEHVPDGKRTEADRGRIAELRKQIESVRKQRQAENQIFEQQMATWAKQFEETFGRDFEKRMHDWAKEAEPAMKEWGKRYGAEMERWGKRFAIEMEKWGQDFNRRTGDTERRAAGGRAAGSPGRTAQERRPADEAARRLAEDQRQIESDERRLEETARQVAEAQRSVDEARREAEESRRGLEAVRRQAESRRFPLAPSNPPVVPRAGTPAPPAPTPRAAPAAPRPPVPPAAASPRAAPPAAASPRTAPPATTPPVVPAAPPAPRP
jgi:BlaR1 peptidase M56